LEEDGYEFTGCKWFKNGVEQKDSTLATDANMKLPLDFPQGIYLIRNEERIVKIVIVQ